MFVSTEEIDKIVKKGGNAQIDYWAYDIVVDRLERTGFKRRSGIDCQGTMTLDGSIYSNEAGDKVVVATHRFVPFTTISSIPTGKKQDQRV